MQRIPCMHCLICVSLGDVWGTVFDHVLLYATEDLRLTFLCPRQVDIRGPLLVRYDKLCPCEHPYRVNARPDAAQGRLKAALLVPRLLNVGSTLTYFRDLAGRAHLFTGLPHR